MYVGAVCHDLDHRGFNNKFMIDVGSPLAAIYSTSTMEHHHFNMSVNILQQENHNIFAKLNPDEYRQEWSYKLQLFSLFAPPLDKSYVDGQSQ